LDLLKILGFIVSCNLTFIPLSDCLYIAIVFKLIVNTYYAILIVWHCIAYIVLMRL